MRLKQRGEKRGVRGMSGCEGEETRVQKKFKNHHETYDVYFL